MGNEKKEVFNQNEYLNQYKKDHYSTFKVDLKKEEKKELDILLKECNLTKKQFLLNAWEDLKAKKRGKDI